MSKYREDQSPAYDTIIGASWNDLKTAYFYEIWLRGPQRWYPHLGFSVIYTTEL